MYLGSKYKNTRDDDRKINHNKAREPKARKNSKRKEYDPNRSKSINRSYFRILTLEFLLRRKDDEQKVTRDILVPILVGHQHVIEGNSYVAPFQLEEASVHPFKNNRTLRIKSLMRKASIIQDANTTTLTELNGQTHSFLMYYTKLGYKLKPLLNYYLAEYGMQGTLEFFFDRQTMQNIQLLNYVPEGKDCDAHTVYIKFSKTCCISIDRSLFLSNRKVMTIIGNLKKCVSNKITYEELNDTEYWLIKLGKIVSAYRADKKGEESSILFKSIVDKHASQRILHFNGVNVQNTFDLFKWAFLKFDNLIKSSNDWVISKRLTLAEYILRPFFEIVKNRAIRYKNTDENNKKLLHLINIVSFTPRIIINIMIGKNRTKGHTSKGDTDDSEAISSVIRYNEQCNDMILILWTSLNVAGPSSKFNVSPYIHGYWVSAFGRIDPCATSTNNPGSSGNFLALGCDVDSKNMSFNVNGPKDIEV